MIGTAKIAKISTIKTEFWPKGTKSMCYINVHRTAIILMYCLFVGVSLYILLHMYDFMHI